MKQKGQIRPIVPLPLDTSQIGSLLDFIKDFW